MSTNEDRRPQKKKGRRKGQRSTSSRKGASRDNLVGAFDLSIRFLLQERPQDFISFAMENRPVRVLGPIAGALPALGRDIDGGYLVLLGMGGPKVAAHVELHRRHQSRRELGQDVLEAQTRIYKRDGVPVLSLVFDLYGDEKEPVFIDEEMIFGAVLSGGQGSRCVYRRVNLRGLRWQDLLALPVPTLWPLLPLTGGGTEVEAFVAARDAIEGRPGLGPVERANHLAVLSFLAEAEGIAAAIVEEYISERKLMQSTLYERIIHKGRAGMAAQTIVRVLRKRLGAVDEAVIARVQAEQDPEVLDRWIDEAVEAVDRESACRLAQRIREAPTG